ncbi:MAG: amidohydrolase family protein [Sphingomonas sp.]
MIVIDTQTHYVPPAALDELVALRARGIAWPTGLKPATRVEDPMCGLDARLRQMDACGIDVSVLSFAPVDATTLGPAAAGLCRIANRGLIEACRAHPDRFVMLASLPMHPEAALAELERLLAEPALRGVLLVAQTGLYRAEEAGIEKVLARAAGEGLAVVLHPSAGSSDLGDAFRGFGLESALQAMVSHALVASRMILSGMLDRLPALDLILTHLGGVLPFLIERLDSRAVGARHPMGHYLRDRLHYDMCGHAPGPALECALRALGSDRMMIGSDWPSRPLESALGSARGAGLAPDALSAVLGGTAARWFDPRIQRRTAPPSTT